MRLTCILMSIAIAVIVGCQYGQHEGEKHALDLVSFEAMEFVGTPHILKPNMFSVISRDRGATAYSSYRVTETLKNLKCVQTASIPRKFDDVAFLTHTKRYVCFDGLMQNSEKPTVALFEPGVGSFSKQTPLAADRVIGVFPNTNAFVTYSFSREPYQHELVLYRFVQSKDAFDVRLESSLMIGKWLGASSFFVDEVKDLVGMVSPRGEPFIWRILGSSFERVEQQSLEMDESDPIEGFCKTAVSIDANLIAVSRNDQFQIEDKELLCQLTVWNATTGKKIRQFNGIKFDHVRSIDFLDSERLLLLGRATYSILDFNNGGGALEHVAYHNRFEFDDARRLDHGRYLLLKYTSSQIVCASILDLDIASSKKVR